MPCLNFQLSIDRSRDLVDSERLRLHRSMHLQVMKSPNGFYEGCPRYYYKKQFQLPVWNLNGNCMKKAKPCMCSDCMPLTLEEWIEYDQRRRNKADGQGTLLRALDGFSPDFMNDGRCQ